VAAGAERSEASARNACQSILGLGGRTPGRSLGTRTRSTCHAEQIRAVGGGAGQAGPMNVEGLSGLVNRVIAWADRLQRRHGVLGFPYAVVKKYGDDEGGRQAALITYYGFLSIFPLLLLGVAILSWVLADHADLRRRLIDEIVPKALRPTIEQSLAALPTSTLPLVLGLIGLLFSGTGAVPGGGAVVARSWAGDAGRSSVQ
jgi:Virulence factor BrkB